MILIDFNHIFLANIFAQTRGNTVVSEDLVRHTVLSCLLSYKKKYSGKYGDLVICADGKKYWRKNEYIYYKANRKKRRDSSGLNWTTVFDSLAKIRGEIEKNMPYRLIEIDTAEADDVIAILAKHQELYTKTVQTKLVAVVEHEPILILSGDEDFVQLQKYPNVNQYAPVQKKYISTKNPTKALLEKIIRGDSNDGIPNILSDDDCFVNPKKRRKPLKETKVQELLAIAEKDPQLLPLELIPNFKRNRVLIDFDCIPSDIEVKVLEEYKKQNPSRKKMLKYFINNRLRNLMEHITEF